MVQLLILIILFISPCLVHSDSASEYGDDDYYDDDSESTRFSNFGQKNNFVLSSSTSNAIITENIRTTRPTTTTYKPSTARSPTKFTRRPRPSSISRLSPTTTKTTTHVPKPTTYSIPRNPSSSTTYKVNKRTTTKRPLVLEKNPQNRWHKLAANNTISSRFKQPHRRNETAIKLLSSIPSRSVAHEDDDDDDVSLEKSESAPNFVAEIYESHYGSAVSNPFNEYSFNNYHYDTGGDSRPITSQVEENTHVDDDRDDGNEDVQLFTTNIMAPKFGSHEGNFGYFKPLPVVPSSKNHQQSIRPVKKFKPVHSDFYSDLTAVKLPLESYPKPLKHFKEDIEAIPSDITDDIDNDDDAIQKYFLDDVGAIRVDKGVAYHHPNRPTSPLVASSEQIERFNADQRNRYESAIEHQLRTSTNLADRGKYHQFLKAQQDEKIEQQSTREQNQGNPNRNHSRVRPVYNNNNNKKNHHPHISQHKPTTYHNRNPTIFRKYNGGGGVHQQRPKTTPGLGHFKTPISDRVSYRYPFI